MRTVATHVPAGAPSNRASSPVRARLLAPFTVAPSERSGVG